MLATTDQLFASAAHSADIILSSQRLFHLLLSATSESSSSDFFIRLLLFTPKQTSPIHAKSDFFFSLHDATNSKYSWTKRKRSCPRRTPHLDLLSRSIMYTPTKQSQGFLVQLTFLLDKLVQSDLGESVKLHPLKVLNNKSVHTYMKNNMGVGPAGETVKISGETAVVANINSSQTALETNLVRQLTENQLQIASDLYVKMHLAELVSHLKEVGDAQKGKDQSVKREGCGDLGRV
ncbi:hypothetical protein F511_11677 [Dorcoceras hygrometricum]|uniref:Uncharacterized protein n=1 Tax=Dorcoceras hygrometricum TaxID=472368 RepID=A0A2Z7B8V7_9LAMI|nr:hypothetical protein F511_11677 [Dorcoceras hygrometricum]